MSKAYALPLLATLSASLLGGEAHAAAADVTSEHYSTKVTCKIDRVPGGIRHRVRIENRARITDIVSMIVSGYDGFTDPPIRVEPPSGWQARVVHWQGKDNTGKEKMRFAVVITCDPDAWLDGTPLTLQDMPGPGRCTDEQGTTRSLLPKQTAQFDVVLPYESAGLIDGRARIVFGDGHVVETTSQRSRVVLLTDQPGRKH